MVSLTSGQLFFEGTEYTRVPSHVPSKMGVARTFQAVRLLGHLTVRQNVMLGAGSAAVRRSVIGNWLNLPRSLADERSSGALADESLARVGMEKHRDSYALLTCRTACSAESRSLAHWLPGPSCSCSTSQSPA